ncbi:MFS transporter [Streptomyces niveus]|uniref:MFS transporter n=1 Tax=Streptomyces niveus TaxID=193462 RepID=A0ABZ1ZYZ3_STRNV|nr:MFS transporter [Streptomyces niveus]
MTLTDSPTPPARTTYGAVLGSPYVARLLGGTLIGRLPNGMAPVAIVLLVTADGGTLAFGGLLSALYGLASALSQPVKGRLMDRHGQTRVSGPAAVLNSAALLALPATGATGSPALAATVVILGGLAAPPLEAGLRALWPSVLPDPVRRHTALALDTGTQGLLYIAGPLLVAALTTAHHPTLALVVTAALGLIGTALVLTAPPSRTWKPATRGRSGTSDRLFSTGLIMLFVALVGVGVAIGAMNVWAVAMAERHHTDLLSGLLPAAFSTGSFLGGLLYGHRTWPGTPTRQLLTGAAGFLLGWLPLLALPGPHAATVLIAVPGAFLTLIVARAFTTTDTLAPPARTTEAYAWLLLSIGVGQAAGTALAGRLADHPHALAALPAVGATLALTVLLLARPGRPSAYCGRDRRQHG